MSRIKAINITSYTRIINWRCFEIPRSLLRGCSFGPRPRRQGAARSLVILMRGDNKRRASVALGYGASSAKFLIRCLGSCLMPIGQKFSSPSRGGLRRGSLGLRGWVPSSAPTLPHPAFPLKGKEFRLLLRCIAFPTVERIFLWCVLFFASALTKHCGCWGSFLAANLQEFLSNPSVRG